MCSTGYIELQNGEKESMGVMFRRSVLLSLPAGYSLSLFLSVSVRLVLWRRADLLPFLFCKELILFVCWFHTGLPTLALCSFSNSVEISSANLLTISSAYLTCWGETLLLLIRELSAAATAPIF